MISETAVSLIQQLGQVLFTQAFQASSEGAWSVVLMNSRFDGQGNFHRECLLQSVDAEGYSAVSFDPGDQVDSPLQSLDKHRIDQNGNEWFGLRHTITRAGEVKISLSYDPVETERSASDGADSNQ